MCAKGSHTAEHATHCSTQHIRDEYAGPRAEKLIL